MQRFHYAHSGSESDQSDWQRLQEHLQNVAVLARDRAEPFGCGQLAYVAGLFHDLGKYSPKFQKLLKGSKEKVDHSTAGAAAVLRFAEGRDRDLASLLSYCIAGHHAGLPDMKSEQRSCLSERLARFTDDLDPIWKSEIGQVVSNLMPNFLLDTVNREKFPFQFAFLGRMIFSCLIDADRRDTENYYRGLESKESRRQRADLQASLSGFSDSLALHLDALSSSGLVNDVRASILAHVRARAAEKPGLFTLTVPTGGGKTLASLAFALDHAKLYGQRRIIYAIPYTSIIDQTAAIFKGILGDEHVLEHHSSIDEESEPTSEDERHAMRLAMEDWSSPVIVTTNVQLFESLFAARPSRCRKLHNIVGSIIILDEAQTLPRHLLSPSFRALEELAASYNCSIVLCTATQPTLNQKNFPLQGRELAPDPARLAGQLRRVVLRMAGDMTNAGLVAALAGRDQALIIVNSRKHALALYGDAKAAGLSGVVHLTTRQFPAHRRRILDDIRKALEEKRPCRVIATSLVEAGVDLDFPNVWRAEAGLDQIAQAAGRCNREGNRPVKESVVTVFSVPDFPSPPELKDLAGDLKRVAAKHADLLSLAAMEDYFGEVYWRLRKDGLDTKGILGKLQISSAGTDFAYRTIADDFQMIESHMVPVIVQRDETAKDTVKKLTVPDIPSSFLSRQLQIYTVQIPMQHRDKLIANGFVNYIAPTLRGEQFAVLQKNSDLYADDVGLKWEDGDTLSTKALVI